MKNITFLTLICFAWISGCSENKTNKAVDNKIKVFFRSFDSLKLPYSLITDASNHNTFNALMDINHQLDSALVSRFELNYLMRELDSIGEPVLEKTPYQFYSIGSVFKTTQYVALLYGRNTSSNEDACVFLATYGKDGKKIDEIVFHRPLLSLPPTEIRRISEISTDTTFVITTVTEEHRFVNERNNYMELVEQKAHDKIYKIEPSGRILLKDERNRQISAEQLKTDNKDTK